MYVEVDLTADPADVVLRDPDDFGSLKVVVLDSGAGAAALHAALEGIGWLDAHGNAMLRATALKYMADGLGRDGDWVQSFDRMVDYAAKHGWVALDGTTLRAHCEWLEP
jgi:hypothetical protein